MERHRRKPAVSSSHLLKTIVMLEKNIQFLQKRPDRGQSGKPNFRREAALHYVENGAPSSRFHGRGRALRHGELVVSRAGASGRLGPKISTSEKTMRGRALGKSKALGALVLG